MKEMLDIARTALERYHDVTADEDGALTFAHGGVSVSRTVTFAPIGASAERNPAWVPRATSTAPFAGIGWFPPLTYCVTTPVSGVFGLVAGNGWMIAWAPPFSAGVRGPQARV